MPQISPTYNQVSKNCGNEKLYEQFHVQPTNSPPLNQLHLQQHTFLKTTNHMLVIITHTHRFLLVTPLYYLESAVWQAKMSITVLFTTPLDEVIKIIMRCNHLILFQLSSFNFFNISFHPSWNEGGENVKLISGNCVDHHQKQLLYLQE